MPDRVSIHHNGDKGEWKAYVWDNASHDDYGKHLVHVYDEPPCIARLAFVAHFNEVMALLVTSPALDRGDKHEYRVALHNLVMKSIREQCEELHAERDELQARKVLETPLQGETKEGAWQRAEETETPLQGETKVRVPSPLESCEP